MEKPVYEFLGYELTKCSYIRSGVQAKRIHINSNVGDYNLTTNLYKLKINVEMEFNPGEESSFDFIVLFRINDSKWYDSVPSKSIATLFMSTSFPYIRQMINAITNDSRGPVNIPTLDLRGVDLEKGITLIKQ